MGQFKPMVKMQTTEPSVVLKLKKGGSASHSRLHSEGAKEGFSPVKKMDGGVMGALSRAPAPTTPMGNPVAARAMAAKKLMQPRRLKMKSGGEVETPSMHKSEMKAIGAVGKELKQHESKPASKAHKGLKTGGVVKDAGGFKEGGTAKKAFATGGKVDTGRPVAMPSKPPSKPVSISRLAGTFKSGGKVEC